MSSRKSSNMPTIPEWYCGRSILITGATGFIGKVLMEKLLRSIPDIGKLYIVVRPKYGVTPSTRVEEITKLPMFQPLRAKNPQVLKKIVFIEGDVSADNLGISEENIALIHSEVSVVFHGAATVNLAGPLKPAIKLNLMGTRNMLELCRGIKNLAAVVYISTTYCHDEVPVVEEKIYPSLWNPRDIIHMATWMNDECLRLLTPGMLGTHGNTYSLTKRLSETLVGEYGQQMPITIVRPSIVMPAIKEPLPGWVDAPTGPVVLLTSIGKGLVKSMIMDENKKSMIIPVDTACNATIIAAWYRGTREVSEIPVYNLCQTHSHNETWPVIIKLFIKGICHNPFDWPLSYPSVTLRKARIVHKMFVLLFQLIPAYIVDFIFMLAGRKQHFVHYQKQVARCQAAQQYYYQRAWNCRVDNFKNMPTFLCEQDRITFYTDMLKMDQEYMSKFILGIRQYFLKEDPRTLPRARQYMKFLYVIKIATQCLAFSGFIWLLYMLSGNLMRI